MVEESNQSITWDEFRDICPIAKSDRRINADIFSEIVADEQIKDDQVFYSALLARVMAEPRFLFRVGSRFSGPSQKDKRKSPIIRIFRWLCKQPEASDITDFKELIDAGPTLFNLDSPARALHLILIRIFVSESSDAIEIDDTDDGTEMSADDFTPTWGFAFQRLRELVADFNTPTLAAAELIETTAHSLVEACKLYELSRAEEEGRQAAEVDRMALSDALQKASFAPAVEDILPLVSGLAADILKALQPLADQVRVIATNYEHLGADIDAAKRAFDEFTKVSNWRAVSQEANVLASLETQQHEQRVAITELISEIRSIVHPHSTDAPFTPATTTTPEPEAAPVGNSEMAAPAQPSVSLLDPNRPNNDLDTTPSLHEADVSEDAVAKDQFNYDVSPVLYSAVIPDPIDLNVNDHKADPPTSALLDTIPANGSPSVPLGATSDSVASGSVGLVIAHYLTIGEAVLAWNLARLASASQYEAGVPAACLYAFAAAPCVAGPYDPASARLGEALAEAMDAIEHCEHAGDEAEAMRARALTFAALVRPALLAPETSARVHLANLSMPGLLSAYAPLQKALAELRREFQPTLENLREVGGAERERRTPEAWKNLREWIEQARRNQSNHQPTTVIFHRLVSPTGEFGKVIEAALSSEAGADAAAQGLLDNYRDNRDALARLIEQCERDSNRPKRDRIGGMALEWICRKLLDGCEYIDRWVSATVSDRSILDDHRAQVISSTVGQLIKIIDSIFIDNVSTLGITNDLDVAALQCLKSSISALKRLLEGSEVPAERRLSEEFRLPLLRLPAECQPRAPEGSDSDFADERGRQEQQLFRALLSPNANLSTDERQAFTARLGEDAILPASELLERLRRSGTLSSPELAVAEQDLQEHLSRARRSIENEIETLRMELVTLYNLDLRNGDQLQKELAHLDAVAEAVSEVSSSEFVDHLRVRIPAFEGERSPGVPADFPQTRSFLKEIRELRNRARIEIARGQKERLTQVARDRPALAEEVARIVSTLDNRDPTTVEDMIASLQAGQAISSVRPEATDRFDDFFPHFVERLSTGSEEFNRGRIDAALHAGAVLGPLDFSHLDIDRRAAAKLTLEYWRRAENALKQANQDVHEPVRRVVEALGFTEVRIRPDTTQHIIPGKLRAMTLTSAQLRADGWFLPPEFGSKANGVYRLFLCNPQLPDDQIANELAKYGADVPSILFMFSRLTRTRRQDFAQRMRAKRRHVLLIDETQIIFLVALDANQLETLFLCAAPFGYVQPYTTDPGNIPREMFFGRKEEIAQIYARSADGCLVYGGRQLGKSALLNHVRKLYHNEKAGTWVFYRSCDMMGGPSDPSDSVWVVIARELFTARIVQHIHADAQAVIINIRKWLTDNPGHRLLFLLDETDQFMSAEARSGYPNLTRLKELMVESAWRFKVVFAGLHNVRRAWKAPNTPLAHFGEPICVGPLNTTIDNRTEARRLVVEPMRAAGFVYEHSEVGWDILARVNHYPSLLQVFCKGLLLELHRKAQPVGHGPMWRVKYDQIFDGPGYRQISEAIRGKFRLTLDLDPRFDLIANVLALYRFDRGDEAVLRVGLPVAELNEEVTSYWPDTLPRLDSDAFAGLLDEMVDLGVLARFGPKEDRYGLRTAQVAQMLGSRKEVEKQIEQVMSIEQRVDYDSALYFRRVSSVDSSRRAPLSDQQLHSLFNSKVHGPKFVVASAPLWGKDVAGVIVKLAESWGGGEEPREGVVIAGTKAEFRKAFQSPSRSEGQKVIVVAAEAAWDGEWVDWSANHKDTNSGKIISVFICSPGRYNELRLSKEAQAKSSTLIPRLWGDQMLRAFLLETDSAVLDHVPRRGKLIEGTGGAPELLRSACADLVAASRVVGTDVDEVLSAWLKQQRVEAAAIGLPSEFVSLFFALDDAGPESVEVLFEILANEWSGPGPAPDMKVVLQVFGDIGVVVPGDPLREGVRLTALGRLLKRSQAAA